MGDRYHGFEVGAEVLNPLPGGMCRIRLIIKELY